MASQGAQQGGELMKRLLGALGGVDFIHELDQAAMLRVEFSMADG